jgi:hypothetical protein
MIKLSVEIERDSHNTYAQDKLVFSKADDGIRLEIEDKWNHNRVLTISRESWKQICRFLSED